MKLVLKNLLLATLLFMAGTLIAQPPPALNYQSVAKDPLGNVAKNRDIYAKVTLYQNSAVGGTRVWEESFISRSDNDGIFLIVIGKGGTVAPGITISDIGKIDWANGPFFLNLKVAVAPSIPAAWWVAADNYLDMGTTQMLSVPYALFAGNASVTNVNTSITPGPINTFLVTDSLGNVNWAKPQAASTTVTTITNFILTLASAPGANVSIGANTTATVVVNVPGVRQGDPILVTPQGDYLDWSIYGAWVSGDDVVSIRLANYTDTPVNVLSSQYKIVVIK
jgi:hypothetical protein